MKNPFTLLLGVLLLPPVALANNVTAQQLQQMRSLNLLVCSNVLVQFNDYEENIDPRRPETYRSDLSAMRQISEHLQLAPELQLVDEMHKQVNELESLPRQGTNRYGHGLENLLRLQQQLDGKLSSRYKVESSTLSTERRALHVLSFNIGKILLLYQTRAFILLPKSNLDISEETNRRLDTQIITELQELTRSSPAVAANIDPIQRRYQFVRSKLINFQQNWAPSGVERYLESNIRDLDRLSTTTVN